MASDETLTALSELARRSPDFDFFFFFFMPSSDSHYGRGPVVRRFNTRWDLKTYPDTITALIWCIYKYIITNAPSWKLRLTLETRRSHAYFTYYYCFSSTIARVVIDFHRNHSFSPFARVRQPTNESTIVHGRQKAVTFLKHLNVFFERNNSPHRYLGPFTWSLQNTRRDTTRNYKSLKRNTYLRIKQ